MNASSRRDVVSSFTIVKGAFIEETYAVLKAWDFSLSKRENLDRLRAENFIGAKTVTWLRDIGKVLNRRFDPNRRDRALTVLAKEGCALHDWKPLLLWHMTRDEFLVRDFLENWLFPAYEAGVYRIRPDDLDEFLRTLHERGGRSEHPWAETTLRRVSTGLLKIATEFGFLQGGSIKEIAPYHLPEKSFLYLLHAIRDEKTSPRKVIDASDWRMFFMRAEDVEQELLRLHQFQKLGYEAAGSVVELRLPCESALQYAERMVS